MAPKKRLTFAFDFCVFFISFRLSKKIMSTEEIWTQFKAEIHNFIKRRISDHDAAEDLLQEIFIKIHLNKDSLNESSKLSSWVYQITRHAIIDYYRKQKLQYNENEIFEIYFKENKESAQISFNNCILPFVEKLEPKYKDALLQTSFGNLSQKEYAEQLQISYSGAKSRVQRARQMVKELFMACCPVATDKYGNIIDPGKCGCDC